jgi:ABC-type phosphate/phosphonate transport system substrate-binding protein
MTTVIRRILCAALLAAGVAVSMPASADVELMFGIYAADNRVKMMWQCGTLVAAMEERMGATLDEAVAIEIDINQNYDQGIDDVTAGLVDFARFPNVDHGWVIHPDVSERVVGAWREAFTALNFERLPYLANPHIFIEGSYGYCQELERLAASERILGALQY